MGSNRLKNASLYIYIYIYIIITIDKGDRKQEANKER
jgi:hypothetical protein